MDFIYGENFNEFNICAMDIGFPHYRAIELDESELPVTILNIDEDATNLMYPRSAANLRFNGSEVDDLPYGIADINLDRLVCKNQVLSIVRNAVMQDQSLIPMILYHFPTPMTLFERACLNLGDISEEYRQVLEKLGVFDFRGHSIVVRKTMRFDSDDNFPTGEYGPYCYYRINLNLESRLGMESLRSFNEYGEDTYDRLFEFANAYKTNLIDLIEIIHDNDFSENVCKNMNFAVPIENMNFILGMRAISSQSLNNWLLKIAESTDEYFLNVSTFVRKIASVLGDEGCKELVKMLLLMAGIERNPGPISMVVHHEDFKAIQRDRMRAVETLKHRSNDARLYRKISQQNNDSFVDLVLQYKLDVEAWYRDYIKLLSRYPNPHLAQIGEDPDAIAVTMDTVELPPQGGSAEVKEIEKSDTTIAHTTEGQTQVDAVDPEIESVDRQISDIGIKIPKQLDRWVLVDQFAINEGTGRGFIKVINLPIDAVKAADTAPNYLNWRIHDFVRPNMVVHIMATATKYVRYGLRVAFFPHFEEKDNIVDYLNPASLSQMPNVFLMGSTNNHGEFNINFNSYLNMLPIPQSTVVNSNYYGSLIFWLQNPVTSPPGQTSNVPISIYIDFPDTKFYVQRYNRDPVIPDPCLTPTMLAATKGFVNVRNLEPQIFGQVVSGLLDKNSILAGPVSNLLNGLTGKIAEVLNFDAPNDPRPPNPIFIKTLEPMALGDGVTHHSVLRLNAAAVTPHLIPNNDTNMNYRKLAQFKSYIGTFNISPVMPIGTKVFECSTTPNVENPISTGAVVGNGVVNFAPVDHIVDDFSMYSGDMIYEFEFVINGFDVVAVRIVYNPNQLETDYCDIQALPNFVFDLSPNVEKKPYASVVAPFKYCLPFVNTHGVNFRQNIGSLSVFIERRFVSEDVGNIEVNVYKCASDNFEVSIPRICSTQALPRAEDGTIPPPEPPPGGGIIRRVAAGYHGGSPQRWGLIQDSDIQSSLSHRVNMVVPVGQTVNVPFGIPFLTSAWNDDVWAYNPNTQNFEREVPRSGPVNWFPASFADREYSSNFFINMVPVVTLEAQMFTSRAAVPKKKKDKISSQKMEVCDNRQMLNSEPHRFGGERSAVAPDTSGEDFSLKSVLRRKEFFEEYPIEVTETVTNRRILRFPVNLGMPHQRDTSPIVSLRSKIAKYHDCFRFFRGGVRYRMVVKGLDPSQLFSYFYVRHHPLENPILNLGEQLETGVSEATNVATELTLAHKNAALDFEVPYYQQFNRILNGSYQNSLKMVSLASSLGNVEISYSGPPWTGSITIYRCLADDACMTYFTGFPERKFVDSQPPLLNVIQPGRPPAIGPEALPTRMVLTRREIQAALIQAGVEQNPGPVMSTISSAFSSVEGLCSETIRVVTDFIKKLSGRSGISRELTLLILDVLYAIISKSSLLFAMCLGKIIYYFKLVSFQDIIKIGVGISDKFMSLKNWFGQNMVKEASNGFVEMASILVSTICTHIGLKGVKGTFITRAFAKISGVATLQGRMLMFFKSVMDVIQKILFYIKYRKTPNQAVKDLVADKAKNLESFMFAASMICNPILRPSVTMNRKLKKKIVELHAYGTTLRTSIISNVGSSDLSAATVRLQLENTMKRLDELVNSFTGSIAHQGVRYEPFILYLSGVPGTGKSFIADEALLECLKVMDITCNEEPIYTITTHTEFHNGLSNQPAYKIDEYLDSHVTESSQKVVELLKSLKSVTNVNANMADLSDKQLQMRPYVIAVISNSESASHKDYNYKAAMDRRRDACYAVSLRTDLVSCGVCAGYSGCCLDCKEKNKDLMKDGISVFQRHASMAKNGVYERLTGLMDKEQFLADLRERCRMYHVNEKANYERRLKMCLQLEDDENEVLPDSPEMVIELMEKHNKPRELIEDSITNNWLQTGIDEEVKETVKPVVLEEGENSLFDDNKDDDMFRLNLTQKGEIPVETNEKSFVPAIPHIPPTKNVSNAQLPPSKLDHRLTFTNKFFHFLWLTTMVLFFVPTTLISKIVQLAKWRDIVYIDRFDILKGLNGREQEMTNAGIECPHRMVNVGDVGYNRGYWYKPIYNNERIVGYYRVSGTDCKGQFDIVDRDYKVKRRLLLDGHKCGWKSQYYIEQCVNYIDKTVENDTFVGELPPYYKLSAYYTSKDWSEKALVIIRKNALDHVSYNIYKKITIAIKLAAIVAGIISLVIITKKIWGYFTGNKVSEVDGFIIEKVDSQVEPLYDNKTGREVKEKTTPTITLTRRHVQSAPGIDYREKIRDATYFVNFTSNGISYSARWFGIGGKKFITTMHGMNSLLESKKSSFDLICSSGSKSSCNMSNVKVERLEPTDLCLVTLNDVSLKRENQKMFLGCNGSYSSDLAIVEVDQQGKISERSVSAHYVRVNNPELGYKVEGFSYPYEKPGLCMSALVDRANGKILSFHVAGLSGTGYSQLVWYEMINDLVKDDRKVVLDFNETGVITKKVNQQCFARYIGDASRAVYINTKTEISRLNIPGFVPNRFPAILRGSNDTYPGETAFSVAFEKRSKKAIPFSDYDVKYILRFLTKIYRNNCPPVINPVLGRISLQSTIFGDLHPYHVPLRLDTSAGYPYSLDSGSNGKYHLVDFEEVPGGRKLISLERNLKTKIDTIVRFAENNVIYKQIWMATLKDERVKPEKMKKPRIIDCCPVQLLIPMVQYTREFVAAFYANRFDLFHAVGMVTHSSEWHDLFIRLNKFNNFIAIDFKTLGPTITNNILESVFKLINNWYKDNGSPDYTQVRTCLLDQCIDSLEIFYTSIFENRSGSPSGSPLTVVVNTISVQFMILIAYVNLTGYDIETFQKNVSLFVYGDDVLMSVSDEIRDLFNSNTLQNYLRGHNIEITSSGKQDVMPDFLSVFEIDFLKCGFLQNPDFNNHFVPVMEKSNIEDIVCWYRGNFDAKAFVSTADSMLKLAAYHGRPYYDLLVRKLNKFIKEKGLKIIIVDYRSLINQYNKTFNNM